MLVGRLGIEGARVPHKDRHGVVWLERGQLSVESGTLKFITAGGDSLDAGAYSIPYQGLSCIILQPGTNVSHDALRILARHGTALVAAGAAGTRFYASMPAGPDDSRRARRQTKLWFSERTRRLVARRMYAMRLGELFPNADLDVLRGMEGARVKATYKNEAQRLGIQWRGRRYDRSNPNQTDRPNEALNHVSVAVVAAAKIAVAVTGTIPQLGFVHEDSGHSFALDIADLFRHDVVVPTAFRSVKECRTSDKLERVARRAAARALTDGKVVAKMIDRIKELIDDAGDDDSDP